MASSFKIIIKTWQNTIELQNYAMTTIKSIPAELVSGLDVHEGDTWQILALKESAVLVRISREDLPAQQVPGKASEWLQDARGSVRKAAHETSEDLRMDYYATKYGVNS